MSNQIKILNKDGLYAHPYDTWTPVFVNPDNTSFKVQVQFFNRNTVTNPISLIAKYGEVFSETTPITDEDSNYVISTIDVGAFKVGIIDDVLIPAKSGLYIYTSGGQIEFTVLGVEYPAND